MTTVLILNDENQVSMNLENKENISNEEQLPPDYQQVNHNHYEKEQDANQESNQGRDQRKATGRLYWCCGDRKAPIAKRRYLGYLHCYRPTFDSILVAACVFVHSSL